jgi:hypothetical protein
VLHNQAKLVVTNESSSLTDLVTTTSTTSTTSLTAVQEFVSLKKRHQYVINTVLLLFSIYCVCLGL